MTNDKDQGTAVPTRIAVYSTLSFELFFTKLVDGSVEIDLVFMEQARRLGTIVHEGDPKKWMAYAAAGLSSIDHAIVTTATGETLREVMDSIAAEYFRGERYTTFIPDEPSQMNNPIPDAAARQWYVGFEEMGGSEMVTLKRGRIKLIIGTIKQTQDGYELELDEDFIDHCTPMLAGLKAPEFDELGVKINSTMFNRVNVQTASATLAMAKEFANVAPYGHRYGFAKACEGSLPEVFFHIDVDKNVRVTTGNTPAEATLVCVIQREAPSNGGRYVTYPSTAIDPDLHQKLMLIADPSYDQVKAQVLALIFKDVAFYTGHRPTEPGAIETGRGGR